MHPDSVSVAVIGLGAAGLAAVKNLVEEGFDVTGFDRNAYVGGLWHYTAENQTSVLPSTIINISKERGCFTDFPFPKDAPSHSTSATVQRYLEDYVQHFALGGRLRLGTAVKRVVRRSQDDGPWEVWVEGGAFAPLLFDKVVVASGAQAQAFVPELAGGDVFEGESIHCSAYKQPELYKGKKVVVVGLCNSGADTATTLQGHASKVYLSYRHGANIIPRKVNGTPFDHGLTMRKSGLIGFFEGLSPDLAFFLTDKGVSKIAQSAFKYRPEWRLQPAPSIKHCLPVVTDALVPLLEAGSIQPVNVIRRAVGPRELEMADGERIEADAIIWCTGYQLDFSIFDASADPTRDTTPEWTAAKGSKGRPLPRLYRNIFSLDHPDSLAFMGCVTSGSGFFPLADLASMALAQVWKGHSALPSRDEMHRAVDAQHRAMCKIAQTGTANYLSVRQGPWQTWANDAAGTGLSGKLGWGVEGWLFWFRERKLYGLLMDGVFTPQVYRLFAGTKRKAWEGARAEIERVNELALEAKKAKTA